MALSSFYVLTSNVYDPHFGRGYTIDLDYPPDFIYDPVYDSDPKRYDDDEEGDGSFQIEEDPFEFEKNEKQFKKVVANPISTTFEFQGEEKIFVPEMVPFSNPLYGVEGRHFFPGNHSQACVLLEKWRQCKEQKDQKRLFEDLGFSTFLKSTLQTWSYKDLICSLLYYYLNYELVNRSMNCFDWKLLFDLIQSPLIGRRVFLFVKENNIRSLSAKRECFWGVRFSLVSPIDPPFNKSISSLFNIKIYYRVLNLLNIEKPLIRNLIKKIVVDQNLKVIKDLLKKELNNKR